MVFKEFYWREFGQIPLVTLIAIIVPLVINRFFDDYYGAAEPLVRVNGAIP